MILNGRIGAGILARSVDLGDGRDNAKAQIGWGAGWCSGHANGLANDYGRKPSKIIWSAKREARARSSGVRTVQVSNGILSAWRAISGIAVDKSFTR